MHVVYAGVDATKLVREILFGSFWSFLFVLSGIVALAVGLVSRFTGAFSAGEDSPVSTFLVCLIAGLFYLCLGILIAVLRVRKGAD